MQLLHSWKSVENVGRKKTLISFSMTQKETLTALSYTLDQHSLTFMSIPLLKMWDLYGCYHQDFPISPEKINISYIQFTLDSISQYRLTYL